jgi:hypothetical protein
VEQIMTDCETPMEQEQTPETLAPDTEQLHARIAELEQAYEEQKNLYLRTLADFQNYRRRQHEEIERQRGLLLESVMTELLPILDNFERALQAAEATRELEPLIEGVRMTERQVKAVLARYDIHPNRRHRAAVRPQSPRGDPARGDHGLRGRRSSSTRSNAATAWASASCAPAASSSRNAPQNLPLKDWMCKHETLLWNRRRARRSE